MKPTNQFIEFWRERGGVRMSQYCISKELQFEDTPFGEKNSITIDPVPFRDSLLCFFCKGESYSCCINCGKQICVNDGYFVASVDCKFTTTVCKECSSDLYKGGETLTCKNCGNVIVRVNGGYKHKNKGRCENPEPKK